jgi:hypothetical protein
MQRRAPANVTRLGGRANHALRGARGGVYGVHGWRFLSLFIAARDMI